MPPAVIWTRRTAAARRSSLGLIPSMCRKCWRNQLSWRCSGMCSEPKVMSRAGARRPCLCWPARRKVGSRGFQRVLESAGALVPGAPVAADPPPARAVFADAAGISCRDEVLAEELKSRAVEDAGSGGDQGGAGKGVQGRGVMDPVVALPGAARVGVLAECAGEDPAGEQWPGGRPGGAGQPQVCEVLGGVADSRLLFDCGVVPCRNVLARGGQARSASRMRLMPERDLVRLR
jgi:hypothetical protein